MPRSRVIVGVIGGEEQPRAAEAIGREIVLAGQVVFTGGLRRRSAQVTQATQYGAASALNIAGVVVRAIGILPSDRPEWTSITEIRDRSLYLRTGITHKERDAINGVTPDVLIALKGGTGTLTEIAFAHSAERPVLLLNCRGHLKAKWIEHRRKHLLGGGDGSLEDYFTQALQIYSALNSRQLSAERLEADLGNYLEIAEEFPEDQVREVVRRAICLAYRRGLPECSGFPGIPRDYCNTREKFELALTGILEDQPGEICPTDEITHGRTVDVQDR